MRTITLELLRHGPPHNQLLSPLTQYLALCDNHPAVTLQLPVEHNQMLYRLRALSYGMGQGPREFQLRDTAQLIGDLLARVPGLTADMNRRDGGAEGSAGQSADDDSATHLRLILSASELALLPFELAVAPGGFPGAGNPLLLQSVRPVTITREARRVAELVFWPDKTRVLFVTASPAGFQPPPAAAHLLALRRALEPWIGTRGDGTSDAKHDDRLAQNLTVLTDATLESIETACAEGNYTHVHILAHGVDYTESYDKRFGLALHSMETDEADIVSGERLATALRSARKGSSGQLVRPAVVTLASCYGGGIASVTGIGASIAHALHADGIPIVIASQFPLSFGGSVRMVELLYEGFLWGEDPRRLLIDLRRMLHTQFRDTHDWASITAYSSLPPDFDRRLTDVQIKRAGRSIEAALDLADEVLAGRRSQQASKGGNVTMASPDDAKEIKLAIERVQRGRKRLTNLDTRVEGARIFAQLASADKHEAALDKELLKLESDPELKMELNKKIWFLLDRARKLYYDAFGFSPAEYWTVVQFISLDVVLRAGRELTEGPATMNEDISKLWVLAEVQSRRDLSSSNNASRSWALGNLIELNLLAPMLPDVRHHHPSTDWMAASTQYAKELIRIARQDALEILATRRQIVRYLHFYTELCPPGSLEDAVAIANEVAKLLPPERAEDVVAY